MIKDSSPAVGRPLAWETIGIGGALVAVCDIGNAMTFWGIYRHVSPVRILQSVASGLLGKKAAFAGGASTAVLGAGLHLLIACLVAAVFYAGCRVWPGLLRRVVATGVVYGLIVFVVMNFVVLPLSRSGMQTFHLPGLLDELVGHALLIGVPLAWVTRWSARRNTLRA